MKVVLLAGGFGTRLSEYTKTIPKPMIEVGGQPMLLHIIITSLQFTELMLFMRSTKNRQRQC